MPACIRIVLRHFGIDLAEKAISRACKTTPRGTDQDEAAKGVAVFGVKAAKLEEASFDDITQYLQQGCPVIVFLSVLHLPYGGQVGIHAVVVNGFGAHDVSFVDPARGEEIAINRDTFLAAWGERGYLGLVIEAY